MPVVLVENGVQRRYRHGNVPNAMKAVVLKMLGESESADISLREVARRVGVSATAAYRHFDSKEDLFASVAAEGFKRLGEAISRGAEGPRADIGAAEAYVAFACGEPSLFRLMFDPVVCGEHSNAVVRKAAEEAFSSLGQALGSQSVARRAAVHGLAELSMDALIPFEEIARAVEQTCASLGH